MSRIAYVNGRYLPRSAAAVSIEDRGYQFADGVYEVIEVAGADLIDEDPHLERLRHSLTELRIRWPVGTDALKRIIREVVSRNHVRDGMVYIQITRGTAPRDHIFPDPPVRPSLVVTAKASRPEVAAAKAEAGIKVITRPDLRWKRPDIKSISLLPNVLAKEEARQAGAAEAWLLDEEGRVREGAASNAWIITADQRVVTHPVDRRILKGITRTTLVGILADLDLTLEERAFTLAEAHAAREAFITGATTLVMPVVAIDGQAVGDGRPGPLVRQLRGRFHAAANHAPVTRRGKS